MIKYTTLWEILMRQVNIGDLVVMVGFGGIMIGTTSPNDDFITWVKEKFQPHCKPLEDELIRQGLRMSATTAHRLGDAVSSPETTNEELKSIWHELVMRLPDEMKLRKYFSIEQDKEKYLKEENLFDVNMAESFPSAEQDIKHAGSCLAFEEWTASVFHSMRVLEIGLQILARDVGVEKIEENWHRLIENIEAKIRGASTGDKAKEQFYSEAALQFRYFKNAWRNHVMHVRSTYDGQQAETIFGHMREFMIHLATRLREG